MNNINKIIGFVFLSLGGVFGTNTILFGPGFPSRFACMTDAYGLELAKWQLPKEIAEKVAASATETTRYIEIPEEVGIERELVESALTLYDESKTIRVGLVYPSIEYRLQLHVAKDYVSAQSTLASLNTLRSLTYVINILKSFAKLNMNRYAVKTTDEAKFGLCSVIVYAKITEKLELNRMKQLEKIKLESKRISHNLSQLSRVKSTGDLWLLTSGAFFTSIVPVAIFLLISIF